MENKPLLSIAVPTKNRYDYLKYLIQLVSSYDTSELELVIQDNSDDNGEILRYLEGNKYDFVKYYYKGGVISMTGNCDNAINNCQGEYVCLIGDDDGVCSNILKCVEWMHKEGIDAIVPLQTGYEWPDAIPSIKYLDYRCKVIFPKTKGLIGDINPLNELKKCMSTGFTDMGKMPRTYQAIVKKSVLDIIYSKGGTYSPGASPDIANAVALCLVAQKVKYVEFPIVISGASKHLGGDMRLMKGRRADIDKLKFLPEGTKQNWESNIPCVWTGITVWPESAVKALKYMGKHDYVSDVKLDYMYAKFITYYPDMKDLVYGLGVNRIKVDSMAMLLTIKRYLSAAVRMVTLKFGKLNNKVVISGCRDIIEAVNAIDSIVSNDFN